MTNTKHCSAIEVYCLHKKMEGFALISVPGPVIFQNTAAVVMSVPAVLELAGTSELSEVYAEYL
jgi:hypothetical protein